MEKPSYELITKEMLGGGPEQAKIVLLAIAIYEIIVLGKKALDIAKTIKL